MAQLESISLKDARKLALCHQGIHRQADLGRGVSAVLNAIEQLAYVQIDTISVVERAHHHTLWNRVNTYQAKQLDSLVAQKKVFEYWSHAAAYLPMRDFRYSLPRKQMVASEGGYWRVKDPQWNARVLKRIQAEGPLQARDFKQAGNVKTTGWWDWKPAKRALESLFMEGELMIVERKGFQKVYDLTERALPNGVDVSMPTPEQYCEYLLDRYLTAHGIGTEVEMAYLLKGLQPRMRAYCRHQLEDRKLVQVSVNGQHYYARPNFAEGLKKSLSRQKVKILSPFDNLLIQRKRAKSLFDFDYQIECYVPEKKRRYGYFVLPILWGQQFAGRLDAKIDRKSGVLTLKHLFIETDQVSDFMQAFRVGISEFLRFNKGSKIEIDQLSVLGDSVSGHKFKKLIADIHDL